MVLWVDQYRPKGLNNLTYHPEITERLRRLSTNDVPHMLFYGISGAGKKTRIAAFLRQVYGPGADKLKVVPRTISAKSKTIEIATLCSAYHVELTPSDVGNNDTHVIQEIIREIAMTQSVSAAAKAHEFVNKDISTMNDDDETNDIKTTKPPYKIVVLHDVDKLSSDAQHGLRRTMEQYTQSCRIILCAESACKVAAPLKSRCLLIRVPAPSNQDIADVLQKVANQEKFTLPPQFAQKIIDSSEGNLRRALLMLEASKATQYPFSPTQEVKEPDWSHFITTKLVPMIIADQSPKQLLAIRAKIYEILANCIPPDVIMKKIATTLASHYKCDEPTKHAILRWAAYYDHRINLGSKPIFHMEAFIAKVMAVYKGYIESLSI